MRGRTLLIVRYLIDPIGTELRQARDEGRDLEKTVDTICTHFSQVNATMLEGALLLCFPVHFVFVKLLLGLRRTVIKCFSGVSAAQKGSVKPGTRRR